MAELNFCARVSCTRGFGLFVVYVKRWRRKDGFGRKYIYHLFWGNSLNYKGKENSLEKGTNNLVVIPDFGAAVL